MPKHDADGRLKNRPYKGDPAAEGAAAVARDSELVRLDKMREQELADALKWHKANMGARLTPDNGSSFYIRLQSGLGQTASGDGAPNVLDEASGGKTRRCHGQEMGAAA